MANNRIDPETYCSLHSEPESALLAEITRKTCLSQVYPRMLTSHLQGRFLSMISQLVCPENILEIGTFTGYSALCLAEGLQKGGKLITIDKNPEMEDIAKGFFEKSAYCQQITMLTGDALEIVKELGITFQLVFIDADKTEYLSYYESVFEKVSPGGYILADNVLWGGKVLEPDLAGDKETRGILKFNEFVRNDDIVDKLMLPLRDGITILRKKSF